MAQTNDNDNERQNGYKGTKVQNDENQKINSQ